MKKRFLVLSVLILSSCENELKLDQAKPEEKAFYTIGQMYASKVGYLRPSEKELQFLIKGIRDQIASKEKNPSLLVGRPEVQKLVLNRSKQDAEEQKTKGKEFVKKFLEQGGKVTDSGLAYKIIKPGGKKRASSKDRVSVDYHGTFIDGHVFDSTKQRKKKAEFPVGSVIRGWQEALGLIGEGGEIHFVLPSDLAYGDGGSPPRIPGGATLVFELTLHKIMKP